MKTIKEIISTLSEEEKELFADLIDECIRREELILQSEETTSYNLERLQQLSEIIEKNLSIIVDVVTEINQNRDILQQKMLENRLKSLPDEVFFRA